MRLNRIPPFIFLAAKLGVPTAVSLFNDEYHGTGSKPSSSMRTQLYLMKWFGKYANGKSVAVWENG